MEVSEKENSNTIPLSQLKFGFEYTYDGKHYRKFPRGPLHSLSQFIQAPPPSIEPNSYLYFDHKTKKLYYMKSIRKHEKCTTDYGVHYWQLFGIFGTTSVSTIND